MMKGSTAFHILGELKDSRTIFRFFFCVAEAVSSISINQATALAKNYRSRELNFRDEIENGRCHHWNLIHDLLKTVGLLHVSLLHHIARSVAL